MRAPGKYPALAIDGVNSVANIFTSIRRFWGRVVSALTDASRALQAAWNQEVPDDLDSRLTRYQLLRHLYAGTIYDAAINPLATQYVQRNNLYAEWNEENGEKTTIKSIRIKPLFNPTYRLVEFYVSHVFRGPLDLENAETGAVPLLGATPALRAAIIQIWKWSNWSVMLSAWVRNGGMKGDAVLRIVDDQRRQKVYLEVRDPGDVSDVVLDEFRQVKSILFEWNVIDPDTEQSYTYGLAIDKETFTTSKDGEPFAYPENVINGEPVAQWPNEYGFVPVVLSAHINIGETWGLSAIAPALPKVNDVNDLASHLGRQERKAIEPQWFLAGINLKAKSNEDGALRRGDNVWWTPNAQATANALVEQIDIQGVIADLALRLGEIARDLPELQVDEMLAKAGASISGRALRILLAPAAERVMEARKGYDADLVRAQQMAVAIAGYRGYLSGFDLGSFERGELDHQIDPNRPIFPSDPLEDLQMEQQRLAIENQRVALEQQKSSGLGG